MSLRPSPAIQSASDYNLDQLVYMPNGRESDRSNVKLGKSVFQVDIYEHLDRPFLSGQIIIKDDIKLYDTLFNVNGTERLLLIFSDAENNSSISKRFVLRKISATKKTDETSEVIIFGIIDETYFLDTVSRFSKAYKGTPDQIIKNILKDKLQRDLILPNELPFQEPMKVVVPYLTPFQAAQWVTNRASTEHGFPYYLYATLFDDDLVLKSLEDMFKEDAWNLKLHKGKSFEYSQARNAQNTSLVTESQLYNITNFKQGNNEDTLHLLERGAVGASYNVVDATTGVKESFRFNAEQLYRDTIMRNSLLGENTKNMVSILDDNSTFGEENFKLSDKDGQSFDRIVMTNTYNDINNYYNEKQVSGYNKDATAKALKNIIGKSSASIEVGGAIFMGGERNRTIGTKIDVVFPNNDPEGILKGKTKDLKRSGEYIIHSLRHIFSDERHVISANLIKLGNLKA